MTPFLLVAGYTALAILLGAGILHLIPRLGAAGRSLSAALCRAPGLDLVVTYFTVAPLIVGPIVDGWRGLLGGIVGQIVGMLIWQWTHELANRDATRGPRIVKVINSLFGRWRNHTAVWLTAIVTPLFWCVRVVQVTIYPLIARLVDFPRYDPGEWVNVSRHKFSGLVGHDLIWCLYCDWMTGVWSLGSEMLRNVESFWCPIRFDNTKKCANCSIDFPDVATEWVPAHATMGDVAQVLNSKFSDGQRGWFGHPARLTIGGRHPETTAATSGNGDGHPGSGGPATATAASDVVSR
jgi:hypothetical protein